MCIISVVTIILIILHTYIHFCVIGSTYTNIGVQCDFRRIPRPFTHWKCEMGRVDICDSCIIGRHTKYYYHRILFPVFLQIWFEFRFIESAEFLAFSFPAWSMYEEKSFLIRAIRLMCVFMDRSHSKFSSSIHSFIHSVKILLLTS